MYNAVRCAGGESMTIERLKKYRYYQKKCSEYDLLIESECVIGCSKGSTKEYPFIERLLKERGLTPEGERLYTESLPYRLEKKALDDYIDRVSMEDLQTQEMFELVFKRGKTYRAAAFAIGCGITEDGVRKRITRYIKIH